MALFVFDNIPDVVARSVAQNLHDTAPSIDLPRPVDYLTNVISEITVETQVAGAALLTLALIDSDWQIRRSGLLTRTAEGLLPQIDVNYPPNTDVWWRLAMKEGTDDLTDANLTLTFQHRIVSYLSDDFGHLAVAPGTKTRAQFVKQLVDRIPKAISGPNQIPVILGPGTTASQQVTFVCPELNVVRPTAAAVGAVTKTTSTNSTTGKQTTVKTINANADATAKLNKQQGVGAGDSLTVKGQAMTATQRTTANAILQGCAELQAPTIVTVAAMYAAIGESGMGASGNTFGRTSDPNSPPSAQISAWLTGGPDFTGHGGLTVASQNPGFAFWQIANDVERNAVWDKAMQDGTTDIQAQADSYFREAGGPAFGGEAQAIVAAGGGGSIDGASISASTTTTTSDVSSLTRGTSDDPDEDSWTCIQRLAQEVNWVAFTDPHPAPDEWGNYVYYMTGPDIDKQKPAFYMSLDDTGTIWSITSDDGDTKTVSGGDGMVSSLSYTVDDTAVSRAPVVSYKGRKKRVTRVATPQTPTQFSFNLIVDYPMQWSAGQSIKVQNTEDIDGRWIVSDITHNTLNDSFAQFTCEPPTQPDPEPTVSKSTSLSSSSTGETSGLAGVVTIAVAACKLQAQKHCYTYTQYGDRTNSGNSPTSAPFSFDCSGFAGGCYKAAGMPPLYGPDGTTGTSFDVAANPNMLKISQGELVPGDVITYQNSPTDGHINIYIGNGQCANMGAPGQPVIRQLADEIAAFAEHQCWHMKSSS